MIKKVLKKKSIKRNLRPVISFFSKLNKKYLVIVVAFFVLGVLFNFLKNQLVVATVNGQPIWRFTLIKELEKQGGKQTLEGLVNKTLIYQEAKKQNIEVSRAEIDEEIKKIEESFSTEGQSLDQVLGLQGMDRKQLEETIKIRKILEKAVGEDIEVADEEIENFIEENKDFFSENLSDEELRESAKKQLKQRKISSEIQTWLQSRRDEANISYFRYF